MAKRRRSSSISASFAPASSWLSSVAAGFVVAYVFHGRLVGWLEDALPPEHRKLMTLGPAEPFLTSMWISLYAAFSSRSRSSCTALGVLCARVRSAHAAGRRRARGVRRFPAAGGLAFGYFVALPAVKFLTSYNDNLYDIQIRAKDYLSFASVVLSR